MNYWEIKNQQNDEVELTLSGNILGTRPIWDEEKRIDAIIPSELKEALNSCKGKKKLNVKIFSGGGDVMAAHAIYCSLKALQIPIEIEVLGMALSAATIILMAADVATSAPNNLIMIHNPTVWLYDDYDEHELNKMQNALITVKDSIIETYSNKCKKSKEEIVKMMDEETWMTGRQALEKGFIDKLIYDKKSEIAATNDNRFLIVNHVALDCSGYKKKPDFTAMWAESEKNTIKNKNKGENNMEFENSAELEKAFPEFTNQIKAAAIASATKESAEAERIRLQEIDKIANHIPKTMLDDAKYTNPVDAKTLLFNAMILDKSLAENHLKNMLEDSKNSNAGEVEAGQPNSREPKVKAKTIDELFQNCVSDMLSKENEPE